jgi:diguanylate cyclase (GGDEF)-like protein
MRPNDLFARTGGDEFVTLLPNTAVEDALSLAERIRAAIEAAPHAVEENVVRMTVSVGIASLNESTTALDALLSTADNALYRAKAAGRNRVEPMSSALECALRRRSDEAPLENRSAA